MVLPGRSWQIIVPRRIVSRIDLGRMFASAVFVLLVNIARFKDNSRKIYFSSFLWLLLKSIYLHTVRYFKPG